jgi:hypothetical protein
MTGVPRCCRGCGLGLHPPTGVRWYQPVADSEPGPMVAAVALYGVPPALWRVVRRAAGGWDIESPLLESSIRAGQVHRVPDAGPTPWYRVGLCSAAMPHPVQAVHRDDAGHWVPGITPGSVRKQSLRLAQAWFAPHALYRRRCTHDVDAGGGS